MRVLVALLMLGALSGCGGARTSVPDVPDTVKTMMAAEFPADGQIHVQRRGKIMIRPETPVCETWKAVPEDKRDGYFGINSDDLFGPLGQSTGNGSGGERQISASAEVCRDPKSVVIYGTKSDNRNGKPYKLVLAVWQGDPVKGGGVWVGGVERLERNYPLGLTVSGIGPGRVTDPEVLSKERIRINTEYDIKIVSRYFSEFVVGDSE